MSGRLKSIVYACLFALALAGGQDAYAAKAHGPARAAATKAAKDLPPPDPALFRIVNGKSTVYLLGSIHILPANFSWRTPAIDEAVGAADAFMFEANLDYATAEFDYFRDHHGYLPPGHTLHEMLSPEALKQYVALIRDLHIDPNKVDYLQPGVAVLLLNNLYAASHPEFGPGVDAALIRYAKDHGKQLGYLESLDFQFDVITKVGGGTQVKVLEKTLGDIGKDDDKAPKLLAAWVKGDLAALRAMDDTDDPNVRALLLDKRNGAWVPRIETMLAIPKTTLVTVGALHLAGKGSVIDLLCAKGWKVQRLEAGAASPACGA